MTTDCGSHHSHSSRRRKILRRIIFPITFLIILISVIILLTWAILKPSKPRFTIQDATVFSFNVSGEPPSLLTSKLQITLFSRNPNDKIGIYYDRLDVYASYRSQQVTFPTSIPRTYQGHKEVNVWSPFVGGNYVPVAPYNGLSLEQEKKLGEIMLMVHIDGRVRWKVGSFITGTYRLYVKCPAKINFGNNDGRVIIGDNAVKYMIINACEVSV
ncbi:unnamed protein product [Cochlearia groenlandica]